MLEALPENGRLMGGVQGGVSTQALVVMPPHIFAPESLWFLEHSSDYAESRNANAAKVTSNTGNVSTAPTLK